MADTDAPVCIQINDKTTDISELKVAELKTELKKRGLPITGNKSELHDKLRKFLIAQPEVDNNQEINDSPSPSKKMSIQQQQESPQSKLKLQQQHEQQQLAALAHQEAALEAQRLLDEQQKQEKEQQEKQEQLRKQIENQRLIDEQLAKTAAATASAMQAESIKERIARASTEERQACSKGASIPSDQVGVSDVPAKDTEISESDEKEEPMVVSSSVTSDLPVEDDNKKATSKEDSLPADQPRAVSAVPADLATAGDSRGNSTERSESCIKEVPMSGDRNRFSRSRSPKPRWQMADDDWSSKVEVSVSAENGQEPVKEIAAKETIESDMGENVVVSAAAAAVTASLEETAAPNELANAAPKARKRKWLSTEASSTKKASMTISTDTLKNYLPNVPAPSPTKESTEGEAVGLKDSEDSKVENENDSEASNDEPKRKFIENSNPSSDLENSKTAELSNTNGYHASSSANGTKQQNSRTVILEETNELIYDDALNTTKPTTTIDSKSADQQPTSPSTAAAAVSSNSSVAASNTPTTTTPTTAAITTGSILHISNLTRPFTVPQLKELLSKYGPLLTNTNSQSSEKHFFWINSVKSHCYVAFINESGAKAACEALNNTQWPQSNPKQLKVNLTTLDELILHMNSDNPVAASKSSKPRKSESEGNAKNTNTGITLTVKNENSVKSNGGADAAAAASSHGNSKQNGKYNSEKENKDRDRNKVREWDVAKMGARSNRSRSRSPKAEKRDGAAKGKEAKSGKNKEESPVTLDVLFRKTKTTPFIYWLPLTEEQYEERKNAEAKRIEDRIRRAEERQMADYESKVAKAAAVAEAAEARVKNEVNVDKKVDKVTIKKEKNPQDSSFDTSKDDLEKSIDALVSKPDLSKKETTRDTTTATARDRDRDRDRDRNADKNASSSSRAYRGSGGGNGNYSSRREPSPADRRGGNGGSGSTRDRDRRPVATSRGYDDRRGGNSSRSNNTASRRDSRNRRRSSTRSRGRKSSDSSTSSSSNSSRSSSSSSSSRSRTRSPVTAAASKTTTTTTSKHARSSSEGSDKRKRAKTNGSSNRNRR
jgi:hypothetical protein